MSESPLIRRFALLLALLLPLLQPLAAAAQDKPYPDDTVPTDTETVTTIPTPGPGLPPGTPYPVFAPGQVLTAAQLNAALAAPTVMGGTINGATIGLLNPQEGRFSVLRSVGNFQQDAGTSVFAGSGNFQVGDNTAAKRVILNSWITPSSGVMTPPLLIQGNAFGTITSNANVATFRAYNVNGDTVNATGAQGGGLAWNYFGGNFSTSRGGRDGLKVFMNHTGPSVAGSSFYVALAGFIQSSGSAGGTNLLAAGNLFGSNISSLLRTGSGLYWNQVVGQEINVGAQAGTGVLDKVGLQIVQWSTDAVAAGRTEVGLLFGAQSYAQVTGWKHGISFGANHATWPMHPTGTLIGLGEQNKTLPARYPIVVARGIDFATVPIKFTTSAIATPGFDVSGTGQITLGSHTLGWSSSGLAVGMQGRVGALSSIAAGGAGYRTTDILEDSQGGVWEVSAVSGGAVTGLTLVKAPTITSGSAPANPLALAGGMGSGATINVSWTQAGDVSLTGPHNGTGTLRTTRVTYNDGAATGELQFVNSLGGANSIAVRNTSTTGYSAYVARDANGIERMAIGVGNSGTPQNDVVYWEASYFTGSPHSTPPPTIKIQQTGFQFGSYNQRNRMVFLPDGRIQLIKSDGNAGFVFDSTTSALALAPSGTVATSGSILDVKGSTVLGDTDTGGRGNALTGSPALGMNHLDGNFLRLVRPLIGTAQIVMNGTSTADRTLDFINTDDGAAVMVSMRLNGTKQVTFGGPIIRNVATGLTAAGTNQAGALGLTAEKNYVATTAASSGVRLPTAIPGMAITVFNGGANTLNVYPASGAAIDGLATNVATTVAAGASLTLGAATTTQWRSEARAP